MNYPLPSLKLALLEKEWRPFCPTAARGLKTRQKFQIYPYDMNVFWVREEVVNLISYKVSVIKGCLHKFHSFFLALRIIDVFGLKDFVCFDRRHLLFSHQAISYFNLREFLPLPLWIFQMTLLRLANIYSLFTLSFTLKSSRFIWIPCWEEFYWNSWSQLKLIHCKLVTISLINIHYP